MGTITCTKLSYNGSGRPPSTSSVFCVASSCDAERGLRLPGSCTASSTRSLAGAWRRRSATCPAASSRSRRPGRSPDRRTDAPRRSTRRVSRERNLAQCEPPTRAFALLPAVSRRPRPRIASNAAPNSSLARFLAPTIPPSRALAPLPPLPPSQPPIPSPILHEIPHEKAATFLLQLLDFGGQSLNVRVVLLLVLRSKPDHTPTDTLNSTRTLTNSSESS